jgi:chromate transport protein ChrA
VTLVGGSIYGAVRKPLAFASVGALLLSGLWNLMTHFAAKPVLYHVALGVKLLLALHVFAMVILAGAPGQEAKRPGRLASAAVSGVAILLLSAYLRRRFG